MFRIVFHREPIFRDHEEGLLVDGEYLISQGALYRYISPKNTWGMEDIKVLFTGPRDRLISFLVGYIASEISDNVLEVEGMVKDLEAEVRR